FFSQQTGTPNNIIAIGDSTENALINLGFKGIIIPKEFNSEGILALPQLKNIYNKSIAIISGESPRPLLSEKLIERGACIKNIFCYVRKPVLHDMNIIFPQLIKHDIKIIISASSESLFYLTKLFENPKQRAWLLEKEIHVISDKMKLEAENFGFKNIKTRNC
ncbi:MAG: uroporphyrinogen-III synthase, partial [Gammaproteobacteria bacterium]|nr:uroporphyrinogen-III synthase [Gammaproteobacteria bacterium]